MTKTALMTGITGQDGYYLSHLMLGRGYRMVGVVSPHRGGSVAKLPELADQVDIYAVDLTDAVALSEAVEQLKAGTVASVGAE